MSQLTRKDDIIKLAVQTILDADPELFTLEELRNRIKDEVLKINCEVKVGESSNNLKDIPRDCIVFYLNELYRMIQYHGSNKGAEKSLKLIFKKIIMFENGDDLIERLFA